MKKEEWPNWKEHAPNHYMPVLETNGEKMKDQGKALMRYICQRHGMYPLSTMDKYNAERIVEIVTTDCAFYKKPSGFWEAEDKEAWCVERNEEILEPSLDRLEKNCSASIKKGGFAATDSLSIADVALLTYIHSIVLNPFRMDYGMKLLKKRKTLWKYWKKQRGALSDYIAYDRKKYLL